MRKKNMTFAQERGASKADPMTALRAKQRAENSRAERHRTELEGAMAWHPID